jgi:hypothetical protein
MLIRDELPSTRQTVTARPSRGGRNMIALQDMNVVRALKRRRILQVSLAHAAANIAAPAGILGAATKRSNARPPTITAMNSSGGQRMREGGRSPSLDWVTRGSLYRV